MTAPRQKLVRPLRLARLPELDDRQVLGWRLARHAVSITLFTFAGLVIAGVVTSTLVRWRATIDVIGALEPISVWPVRSLESGALTRILVRTGDSVIAGQPIAILDSLSAWGSAVDLEWQLSTARVELQRLRESVPFDTARLDAAVAQAEARVAAARTALRERMAEFGIAGNADSVAHASGTRIHIGLDAPSAAFFNAEGELSAARTQRAAEHLAMIDITHKDIQVRRLEALLAMARNRLRRGVVHAPASGVVLTDQVDQLLGSVVAAGQSFMEIGDLTRWRATLAVSENDVYQIHPGDTATIEIPAFATLLTDRFRGRIESVGWQPTEATGNGQHTAGGYRVVVHLDPIELPPMTLGMLRRGYAARGRIVTHSASVWTTFVEYLRSQARGITP